MQKSEIITAINESKLVAVIRGESQGEALEIAKASILGGIKLIELTYTTPNVDEVFKELEALDVIVGAGTVLDVQTARNAILKGAKFIVSPYFDEEVARLCNRYGILYMPGCMTIKEIMNALEYGCSVIKLFPANTFTPNFIRSIKAPIPNVEVMPTGGINLNNIKDWVQAGAFSVGIGSDLTKAYRTNNTEGVIELAKKYINSIREVN